MAMDILDEIVRHKRLEVEHFKQEVPPAVLYAQVERLMAAGKRPPSMRQALLHSATGIIAEFKRRSPSKGWIKEEGRADVIPLQYQLAGATALSILTDRHFFGGDDRFIRQAADVGVCIPVLYKNFIIDEYQLFQARLAGASAVLLIAADLSRGECAALLSRAHELCCLRCMDPKKSTMPTSGLTSTASTTGILALSLRMWNIRSAWPKCCPTGSAG